MMKTLLILFFPLLSSADDFVVARGQTLQIPAPAQVRIHATNPQVIKIRDLGSKISITGLKLGQSTLVMGKHIHHVYVYTVTNALLVQGLEAKIKKMMGLKLNIQDGKTWILGELLRWKDWEDLAETYRQTSGEYFIAAKMSEELKIKAQSYFEQLLRDHQLAPIRWNFFDKIKAFVGTTNETTIKAYQEFLKPYGIEVVKDPSTLALEPMVEVEILVVELQKRAFTKFGVSWPSSYSAEIVTAPTHLRAASSFSLALDALEENGEAQVLASPKLLCRSGKSAEFLAGGEFPIKIRGRKKDTDDSAGVVWKKHGVLLKIRPRADLSGRMSIELETEVSAINFAQTVEDLPSLNTNRIQSHFDLEKPVTLALSGLLKSQKQNMTKGLPILSQIPILGALFSSRDFLEDRSELVFFVTPRVIGTNTTSSPLKIPQGWQHE
ncbi:MAG: hypothetical protein AB7F59_08110 [Bdellovibrionales bacterium]